MWPEAVNALLGGTTLASLAGAAIALYRTRQQGKIVEADVVKRLTGSAATFAESVRLDAQAQINDIRREAQTQIDRSAARAEAAEDEARSAQRSAGQAWDQAASARRDAMDSAAAVRRMTNAIQSPYATLEGLRAMVSPETGSNGVGMRV